MNPVAFFGRPAEDVAKDLLGMILVRNTGTGGAITGKILEVGAYEGGNQTASREGMLYSPGSLFMMPFRGTYFLNVATDAKGTPSCVELRAVSVQGKSVKGSGAVANAFQITPDLDVIVLGNEVEITGEPHPERVKRVKGSADNCIGLYLFKQEYQ